MKILIIGSSVVDKILNKNGYRISAGGIYHSVLKLSEIKNSDDVISLCTLVDKKNFHLFEKIFENCNEKFFTEVNEISNVTLDESNCCHRKEIYFNEVFSLKVDNIDFSSFDGILINMITGYEIDVDTLKKIRNKTKSLIYFDVHTLSRKSDKPGLREFQVIKNFESWALCLDIIQVNEFELNSLFDIKDEFKVAEKLFSLGVKILIVTKSEKGATIFFKKNGEMNFYHKKARKIIDVETIGCGDYFGSSFFYKYLITKDEIISLNFAVNEVEKTLERKLNAVE